MKKYELKVAIFLFLVSFFAEVYFVTATTKDFISIIGIGLVIIISSFLIIDSIEAKSEENVQKTSELIMSLTKNFTIENLGQHNQNEHILKKKDVGGKQSLEEKYLDNQNRIETINKAIYTTIKREHITINDEISELQKNMKLLEEISNASTEEVITYEKKAIEANKKILQNQKVIFKLLTSDNKKSQLIELPKE